LIHICEHVISEKVFQGGSFLKSDIVTAFCHGLMNEPVSNIPERQQYTAQRLGPVSWSDKTD
jgi:hypothetical protein